MKTPIAALLALLLSILSAPLHAATVSGLLYTAESSLRVVDFDGTGFTSGSTTLTQIFPDWTAMSYDPASSLLYYTADSSLRVVGFDGTGFTSGSTTLTQIFPDWTAMSYDPGSSRLYYTAESSLRVVGFDGTGFTTSATILTQINPNWTAMGLLFASAPPPPPTAVIPLPAAGWLLLGALGALSLLRRRTAG